MTLLELNDSMSFTIKRGNREFRFDIQENGIVINDFIGESKVTVTINNENIDMIHHDKVHTLHFKFSGDNKE